MNHKEAQDFSHGSLVPSERTFLSKVSVIKAESADVSLVALGATTLSTQLLLK